MGLVMHEIIQQVLARERQAKEILAEATNEAQRVVSQAQARAKDLLAQARQTGQREAEDVVAAAVKAAKGDKEQQLARMAKQFQTEIRLDPEITRRAVEAAVGCICGELSANSRTTAVNLERTETATPEEPAKESILSHAPSMPAFSTPSIRSG